MKIVSKLLTSLVLSAAVAGVAQAESANLTRLAAGSHVNIGAVRGGETTVYDSTSDTFTTTGSTPRSFIGGVANLAGAGPQVDITSIDVYMGVTAAVNYTNVRARIQFWNTYSSSATPVFSNAAGAVIEADIGAFTSAANQYTIITINLPTPLRLNSLSGKGFAVSFQADSGGGLAATDNLTSTMNYDDGYAVGSSGIAGGNGFFRNASGRTDFNFLSSDLRTFTGITDVRTSLVLRGNADVPVSLQSFDVD